MITGILGILKSGCAYLPIDPDFPQDRMDYMLKDSGAKILLATEGTEDTEGVAPQAIKRSCEVKIKDEKRLKLTGHRPPAAGVCYVIYTSGSTGKPKGVMIEHRNAVSVICWFGRQYGIGPGFHVLQMSDYTFDPSVEQIFGTIIFGGVVHMIRKEKLLDVELFRDFIERHRIDMIDFVPKFLDRHFGEGEVLKNIKAIICGGEKLDDYIKNKILEKGYPLFNQYGPTETTIDVTMNRCTLSIPGSIIGKPIANVKCYIVDKYDKLQPVGIPGELWVGGDGVVRGYLNNPELTANRFTGCRWPVASVLKFHTGVNDFSSSFNPKLKTQNSKLDSYVRLYKTGDLARWLPDGNIEFLGRIDTQVKIRGFRIELGEIESRIKTYEGIDDVVVIDRQVTSGDKSLCAYIVSSNPGEIEKLKHHLSLSLPQYMIPDYWIPIERIPLTSNGKIDKKALPVPGIIQGKTYIAPRNEIEEKIVQVWSEILGIKQDIIGIDESFFNLGGNSMKIIGVHARLKLLIQENIPVVTLFTYPTIRALSNHFIDKQDKQKKSSLGEDRTEIITSRRNKLMERKRK
jgi:iturin family lipopeptide synthetase B